MTETPSVETAEAGAAKKPAKKAAAKSGGLSSMLLADLKSMAVGLGIAGALIGGFLFGLVGLGSGGFIWSLITATIGAILLVWIVGKVRGARTTA